MKIRAQVGMVLNLDKCIGCHTCSVTCKNVWTSRDGVEYAWFNNVETKPGIGFPKNWEDQEKWNGGWVRKPDGKLVPKQGGKLKILANIFANPNMPQIDDYYEPFTYDYEHLQNAPQMPTPPTARPVSVLTGKKMDKVEWGPNWEDDLAGEFEKRGKDVLFEGIQKEMHAAFEQTFMMYLPRLCEHCLNPTCIASCPSGSIYKREDDGIVLIDQDKCRGWRMCVSGCPYKKIYYNWTSGKAEKCTFCYPRIEGGQPTVCSETCVGRIRYLGVLLYDADKIEQAASVENPQDLYEQQLGLFLNPNDPEVEREALKQGISQSWIDAAKKSPVYKMAMEWKVAFPLHPEYRTLPMVWYIPPLSPIQSAIENGLVGEYGMSLKTAAFLAACFSLPGGVLRALGGYLSDKFGAYKVTWAVMWVCWVCFFLLSYPQTDLVVKTTGGSMSLHIGLNVTLFTILMFTVGVATAVGKASVFKFVADDYPNNIGAVSGIVGLAGGMGGFLLPIMFGALEDFTGIRSTSFMLLYGTVCVSLIWMHFSFKAKRNG